MSKVQLPMDGVYVRCPSRHPETGGQCVRLANTHWEHQDNSPKDVWTKTWTDGDE